MRFATKTLTIIYQNLDDYIKVDHSDCVSGEGYQTANDAKLACSSKTQCMGILEEECGKSSTYYVCQNDIKKDNEIVSCVHKKRESFGMSY